MVGIHAACAAFTDRVHSIHETKIKTEREQKLSRDLSAMQRRMAHGKNASFHYTVLVMTIAASNLPSSGLPSSLHLSILLYSILLHQASKELIANGTIMPMTAIA